MFKTSKFQKFFLKTEGARAKNRRIRVRHYFSDPDLSFRGKTGLYMHSMVYVAKMQSHRKHFAIFVTQAKCDMIMI